MTGPLAAAGLAVGESPRGEAFVPEDLPSAIAWQRSAQALYLKVPADAELDEFLEPPQGLALPADRLRQPRPLRGATSASPTAPG